MNTYDANLKRMIDSGINLLSDTKMPRKANQVKKATVSPEDMGNPYEVFIKRTINEKPSKEDIIKELERFIKVKEKEI